MKRTFTTILSYSPYDNVAAKDYPAILAMAGLTDPRVTYWEPAKWIARLRATMTGGGPVLLRTNMGAGHGGASGRFNRLDEVAIAYAFALWAVGMAEKEAVGAERCARFRACRDGRRCIFFNACGTRRASRRGNMIGNRPGRCELSSTTTSRSNLPLLERPATRHVAGDGRKGLRFRAGDFDLMFFLPEWTGSMRLASQPDLRATDARTEFHHGDQARRDRSLQKPFKPAALAGRGCGLS